MLELDSSVSRIQFTTVLRIIIILIDTVNMRMITIMLMAAIDIAPKALYFILNSTATKISMKLEINERSIHTYSM